MVRIDVIGDYEPTNETHLATRRGRAADHQHLTEGQSMGCAAIRRLHREAKSRIGL
jgi:hypothetical protein